MVDLHDSPWPAGEEKNVEPTERLCYSIAAADGILISSWGGRRYGSEM